MSNKINQQWQGTETNSDPAKDLLEAMRGFAEWEKTGKTPSATAIYSPAEITALYKGFDNFRKDGSLPGFENGRFVLAPQMDLSGLDQNVLDRVKSDYQSGWADAYDVLNSVDTARKTSGSMPVSYASKYTDSDADLYLLSQGLPSYSQFSKYYYSAQDELATEAKQKEYSNAVLSAWQSINALTGPLDEDKLKATYEDVTKKYSTDYTKGVTYDDLMKELTAERKNAGNARENWEHQRIAIAQQKEYEQYQEQLAELEKKKQEEAEAQAALVSKDSEGYKKFGDNWARYVELSQKESLTSDERREAKAALKAMQGKYNVVDQSDVFYTNMPAAIQNVYINLQNKSNWGAGLTAGFADAFGVDWLMDKAMGLAAKATGQETNESVQDQFAGIKAANEGTYTAGNVAGNLASLLMAGDAIGSGATALRKAVPWLSKVPSALQNVVVNSLAFGAQGAYQGITNTVTRDEWNQIEQAKKDYYLEQGYTYKPIKYNAWDQVSNVLKQAGISAVGGAAGSIAGTVVGDLGKSVLVKYGLQTPFAEALRQTLSGTAFAAGRVASTYWLYPEGSRPTKEQIAQDIAVSFLFSAITSAVSTAQTTKQNKAYIENAVEQMRRDYQSTLNEDMTPAQRAAALDKILEYNNNIRSAISQHYYAGQQSYINEVLQGMDAINEQIGIIKSGLTSGTAASSGNVSGVPSTVGAASPTQSSSVQNIGGLIGTSAGQITPQDTGNVVAAAASDTTQAAQETIPQAITQAEQANGTEALTTAPLTEQQASQVATVIQTAQNMGLDKTSVQTVFEAYAAAVSTDTQSALKFGKTIKNAAAQIAEVESDLNISTMELKASLQTSYDAMTTAMQSGDTAAFSTAKTKYLRQVEIAGAKNDAAKLKAANKMEALRNGVVEAAQGLREQVNQNILNQRKAAQRSVAPGQTALAQPNAAQPQSKASDAGIQQNASQTQGGLRNGESENPILPEQEYPAYPGRSTEPVWAEATRPDAAQQRGETGRERVQRSDSGIGIQAGGGISGGRTQNEIVGSKLGSSAYPGRSVASGRAEATRPDAAQQRGETGRERVQRSDSGIGSQAQREIAKEPTEAAKAAMRQYLSDKKTADGHPVTARFVERTPPEFAEAFEGIKDIAGNNIPDVFLYESDDAFGDGWTDGAGIFVRMDGANSPAFTLAHEIAHNLPDINAAGRSVIDAFDKKGINIVDEYAAYRAKHVSSPDEGSVDMARELIADMYGAWMMAAHIDAYNPSEGMFGLDEDAVKHFQDAFFQSMVSRGTAVTESVQDTATIAENLKATGDPEYSRIKLNAKTDAAFAQKVDEVLSGKYNSNDLILVGSTPDVLTNIGLNRLPVTITKQHIESIAKESGNRPNVNYHGLGDLIKQLPHALRNPVMVIESATQPRTSIVVLADMVDQNGKRIVVPAYIDGSAMYNGVTIDSNVVTSMLGKGNAVTKLVKEAVDKEAKGQVGVYYFDATKSHLIVNGPGFQLPSRIAKGGYIHSIREAGSPVNWRNQDITYTRQFKHWFGDWTSSKVNASKVVDEQGKPLMVYHGTNAEFSVFSSKSGVYWFGDKDYVEEMAKERNGNRIEPFYLNMRNPYRVTLKQSEFSDPVFEQSYIEYAKRNGYDGVVFSNDTTDPIEKNTFYTVFKPEQIKNATDNIGTFNPNDPDVYFSRVKFQAIEGGKEYSYAMPEIKQKKDGTFYADFTVDGEKTHLEDRYKEDLEDEIKARKQESVYNKRAKGEVKQMMEVLKLYRDKVSVAEYYRRGGGDHEVALALRGMYLSNGINQGGMINTPELDKLLESVNLWKESRIAISYSLKTPQRLWEDMAEWRDTNQPGARAGNYFEGERLKEAYWGFLVDQNAAAELWKRTEAAKIRQAYDGNPSTSTLAQMLGEGIITEADVKKAVYGNNGMIVTTENGTFVFTKKWNESGLSLAAISSGGELLVFSDSYRKKQKAAMRAMEEAAQSRIKDSTNQEHLARVRKAYLAALDKAKPTEGSGNISIMVNGSTTTATANGTVLLNIVNGSKTDLESVSKLKDALVDFYGRVLPAQNGVLTENGYRPIPMRQNYFPHLGRQSSGIQDFMDVVTGEAQKLQTAISGLTSTFSPGRVWVSHVLERMGDLTEYDAIRGFTRYLDGASNLVFYTPVIQRYRQLEKYVREYSLGSKNTKFAAFLHDYTNQVANKKADLDRSLEDIAGREVYTVSDKLTGAVGASSVAGNFSVGLSNYISFFTSLPGLEQKQIIPAIRDTVRNGLLSPKDGFIDKIPALTSRLGKNEKILESRFDRVKEKGSIALGAWFDITDRFSNLVIARAKYAEFKGKGYTEEEAIRRTNDYFVKMFADRAKGMTPKLFTSKAVKPLLQFQLEAVNQLSHFRDLGRQDIAEQIDEIIRKNNGVVDGIDWEAAENKIKATTPRGIWRKVYYLLMLSLWGVLTRAFLGRDQTWNPAGIVMDVATSDEPVKALWDDLTDQAPIISIFTGGRVPIAGGVEGITEPIGELFTKGSDKGNAALDLMKGIIGLVPGGSQIKKTTRGIKAYSEGGYYTDNGRLKYPVEQNTLNFFKILLNGPSSVAPQGYDWQNDTLSTARTGMYEEAVAQGINEMEAYDFLQTMDSDTNAGKLVSIAGFDSDGDKKPDFSSKEMNIMAAVIGVDVPKGKTVPQYAKEQADAYIERKRKDNDLSAEKKAQAEAYYGTMLKILGIK